VARKELTQAIIEEWVSLAPAKFSVRDIWHEVGIESTEAKHHLRVILGRLDGKTVKATPDGLFHRLDGVAPKIQWHEANPDAYLPISFPFGLEEYVKIFPKSIIVIAGSKNAGKTGFLYNFINMNMGAYRIDLYNSETGPEQMKERFDLLSIPYPPPFETYERYDNFAEIIDPEHISVVDYLDFNSEVYLVGAEIDAIFRKLTKGVALLALQKAPPGVTYVKGVKKIIPRDLGYGGAFSAKRSVLYLSMDSNRLKVVYAKTPKSPKLNPNNMTFKFKIEDGIHFTDIQRVYEQEDNYIGDEP